MHHCSHSNLLARLRDCATTSASSNGRNLLIFDGLADMEVATARAILYGRLL